MLISVIVVNWNGAKFLKNCLDSILNQSYRDLEILVIDNTSEDESIQIIRENYPQIRLISNSENRGYCKGCNQGIQLTTGTYILILNPDTILTSDFVKNLMVTAERDSQIGMVAGKLLRFDQVTLDTTGQFLRWNLTPLERGYGNKDVGQFNTSGYIFSTCGAAAFYKRAMLEAIKIKGECFDESFFTYYEDLDLGWRAQLFGWKCYYNSEAVAYHYRGGGLSQTSNGKRNKGKGTRERSFPLFPFPLFKFSFLDKPFFLQRHILKNRYLTLLKNLGIGDLILSFPALLLFESLVWGYICLARPKLLGTLSELFRLLPETWEKRRIIQSRRVVSSFYIGSFMNITKP